MSQLIQCLLYFLLLLNVLPNSNNNNNNLLFVEAHYNYSNKNNCDNNSLSPPIPYADEHHHHHHDDDRVYKVGVLAIRGLDAARSEFSATFEEYLTATAGQRFDPQLQFEMVPLNFMDIFTQVATKQVDFIYVNPSAFSCMESEFTAYSLVSQMSRRRVADKVYDLEKFGGVIMVHVNSNIYQLTDLENKIIAAASLSGLGSGQMQFLELQNAGMSYIQDPKQLVFTSNQAKVVNGVLSGQFDVGFVRTDQMERTIDDSTGALVNTSLFRIIDPKPNLTIDGVVPFPFQSSTPLYPEWNVAALDHVPDVVSRQVQAALLALAEHGHVGLELQQCQDYYDDHNNSYTLEDCIAQVWGVENTNTNTNTTTTTLSFPSKRPRRCDTTPEIAQIANKAMANGKYSKWMTTLSYMQLRSMQEVTGFIYQDPHTNVWKCYRSSELYDTITCPENYRLKPQDQVAQSCAAQGLECRQGFQCVCKPCRQVIEVCLEGIAIGKDKKCVSYQVFLPSILVPLCIICAVLVHLYVEYKRRQADSVWAVQPQELQFDSPSKIIGMGTFGFVLAAEYRGTQVAVKRVIPPHCVNCPKKWIRTIPTALSYGTGKANANANANGGDASYSCSHLNDDIESQLSYHSGLSPSSSSKQQKATAAATKKPNRKVTLAVPAWDAGGGNDENEDGSSSSVNNPGLQSMTAHMAQYHHRTASAEGDNIYNTTTHPLFSADSNTRNKLPSYAKLKAEFVQEMRHIAKLRHPCITTVMGAVISNVSEPMLVMEYMELGSLYEVLRNDKTLDTEERIMPILQDIAQGVRFLHAAQPQVIHGDLKTKNVLIDGNYRAKVTDFGLSAKHKKLSAAGTPYWMAPELLRGESTNTAASDMYALGVIMYELYSRQNPYQGKDHNVVLRQVCDPEVQLRPQIPSSCPPKVAELMKLCWAADPHTRPTAETVDLALRVEGGVKERTSRLEKLNRELEEANAKIAAASTMQLEHFACMSHEIRTPLNCIVGLSSLMQDSDLSPSQKESMGMITSSSRLLQSIVNDVLDYSKLESGNAEVLIKRTDLQDVISEVVQSMRASPVVRNRNVTIQTHYHPSVPQYFETDGRKLLQILFNLVSNAAKFSREDGVVDVKLVVCDEHPKERLESNPEDIEKQERSPLVSLPQKPTQQLLRLQVKDYGKGIEAQEFDNIFRPFAQTNSGIRNIDGGTGLGLAITKKLVKALGGSISVNSVFREWTEFTVDLPCDRSILSIDSISSKLSTAEFFFVGDRQGMLCEKLANTFDYFKVKFSAYSSAEDLEEKTRERERPFSGRVFCLVQGEMSEQAFQKLSKSFGIKLITLGRKVQPSGACANFECVEEIAPSAFLLALRDVVEQHGVTPTKSSMGEASESKVEQDDRYRLSHLRVLIAEDNIVNQKILVRMLRRLGLEEIEVVDNGQKAVDREAVAPFDLILMDMQMPVMDGIDATNMIKSRREGDHPIPLVIFVTAHVSSSFEQMCLECGAAAYLPKPYSVAELKRTLHNAMHRSSSSREFSLS